MKPLRSFWRVFWSDRRAAAAAVFLLAEILLVLLLPLFLGQDPNVTDRTAGFWAPPSPAHLLGTDEAGRDLLSRLLAGGRVSLLVGFASAALGGVLGVPLGLLAGYKGGKWEYWIMRACDTFQSFPSILLVLAMVTLLGPSVWNIILVIGGSLGSVKVNQAVRSILPRLLEKFQVIHICGKGNLDESLIGTAGYVQYEYVDSPLKHLFAAADLIVSRAGANSICEILALRKPNVLIPLSAAASRGDQILNARSFAGQGFSEVLEEEQMTDDTLLNAITDTYENRRKFVEAMEKSHLNNAVHTIMELIQAVQ